MFADSSPHRRLQGFPRRLPTSSVFTSLYSMSVASRRCLCRFRAFLASRMAGEASAQPEGQTSNNMEETAPEEEEAPPKPCPDMEEAQWIHLVELAVTNPEVVPDGEDIKRRLLAKIQVDKQEPLYTLLCEKLSWQVDDALQEELKKSNEEELKTLEEQIKVATETLGDIEVLDALLAKEKFFMRIGNKAEAYKAAEEIFNKPKVSTGKKIDVTMDKVRVGLFFKDQEAVRDNLERAKKLIEDGGDWDRRNRLKVYEALALITARNVKKAAELLLDCIATFTCVELTSYNQFIFYAVVTNILTLERMKLKKKLVDGPEVIAVLRDLPVLGKLLNSFYGCEYTGLFNALVDITPDLVRDRYISPHVRYLIRELRVLAYTQFLESYKTVRLSSMAQSFGVSVDFVDNELSRFIASGRLCAKIDKVGGVVETSRPDTKNAQYQQVIKNGDLLLNRLSKLARMVDY